ncbi:A disintegrin and metalloproteinase with thrombospondin motifs adt-1 [Phymastichus coffea]|uniref:A disintegrin and metalloproteinase with thrombospondin motifs adt-1 n=1 Tax=Phymastichus coffea TaxID=108790 RepID=UPI00273ACB38|nr:A disintegrin and metalloproteinase with thrombospondin motifs adt-1 [Phymastichus coffea]
MSSAALLVSLLFLGQLARAQTADEDFEVVLLPTEWSAGDATVPLRFSAFGQTVELLLRRNERLLAPSFELWTSERNRSSRVDDRAKRLPCHYLHENSRSSAAVSLCEDGSVRGLIFLENDGLEIRPLSEEETASRAEARPRSLGRPHAISRRRVPSLRGGGRALDRVRLGRLPRRQEGPSRRDEASNQTLTIELALFLDEAGYKSFEPHFSGDEGKLRDLLLAYVNNIQALYHHPSLGRRIDLALVRLELMRSQPRRLAGLDGERDEVLEAFCQYAEGLNPAADEDPQHWDMGLYVSGLDLYAAERGARDHATMGLAPVGGVCWARYACAIAEFGVGGQAGRAFPSAGFAAVYVAAHEMAHNLGMHHDSAGNGCPADGYIMSPSRGLSGETHWSGCSREVARSLAAGKPCLLDRAGVDPGLEAHRHLDHRGRFGQLPGRRWTAKRQCELLLRDRAALAADCEAADCCGALRCRAPGRAGVRLAGPALDGTRCAEGRECRAGECLPPRDHRCEATTAATAAATAATALGWSEWREGGCESGCIRGSRGFVERRRSCLDGAAGCAGPSRVVALCADRGACEGRSRRRLSAREHAGLRCSELGARGLGAVDGGAGGLQAAHEPARPWLACALFCRHERVAAYFPPRTQLEALGLDPYFPDGTWCHRQDGRDYFCREHRCLPEDFGFNEANSPHEDQPLQPVAIERHSGGRALGRDEDTWLDSKDYAAGSAA